MEFRHNMSIIFYPHFSSSYSPLDNYCDTVGGYFVVFDKIVIVKTSKLVQFSSGQGSHVVRMFSDAWGSYKFVPRVNKYWLAVLRKVRWNWHNKFPMDSESEHSLYILLGWSQNNKSIYLPTSSYTFDHPWPSSEFQVVQKLPVVDLMCIPSKNSCFRSFLTHLLVSYYNQITMTWVRLNLLLHRAELLMKFTLRLQVITELDILDLMFPFCDICPEMRACSTLDYGC